MPPTPAPGHRLVMDQQSWTPDKSYLTTTVYTATAVAVGSATSMTTTTTTHLLASDNNNGTFFAASSSSSVDDTAAGGNVSDATAQLFLVLLLTTFIVVSIVVLRTVTHTSAFPTISSSSSTTRRLLPSHGATRTLRPSAWFLVSTLTHESDALMMTTTTTPASTSLFYGATPATTGSPSAWTPGWGHRNSSSRGGDGDENNSSDNDSDTASLYYYYQYQRRGRGNGSGSSSSNGVQLGVGGDGITDGAMEEATYEALLQLEDVLGSVKTGLSDEQIEILPCYTYMQHDEKEEDDNESEMKKTSECGKETRLCAICRDDVMHLDRMRMLPCGDDFHAHCIARWLKMHPSCPLCRTRFA